MTRVRVLRIQSRICVGGPALHTILLGAVMDAGRYRTILVGGRLEPHERSMAPLAYEKGVPLHLIEEMGRTIRWTDDLKALWKLIKLIRYYKPHVVHTHTAKAGAIGRVAAFFCRVPLRIHTFHGHVFHGYFSPFKTRLFIRLERWLARTSHCIIAISPSQKKDLTETYKVVPERKCRVIRLGFELEGITTGAPGKFKKELGLLPETRLVGILARLVPIKNHQLLLRAIAHWRTLDSDTGPDRIRFLVIGDGELKPELEALAQSLDIAPFLIFTGWRSNVADIYADLDLNVLVSKNEGTPVTLIEGLACGVPLLSTDVGGIRDFADEDCGEIVPPDIPSEALGQKLFGILNQPGGLKPLDEGVRCRILQTYDVARLVADMEALYESFPQIGDGPQMRKSRKPNGY